MNPIRHYRDLKAYQNAMDWMIQVFQLTKTFPVEEKYSQTDRIRRSSRSVCANLVEAWRKRRYEAAFIAKLSDAETEAAETQVHAEIAFRSGYLTEAQFGAIDDAYDHIIGQIVKMADHLRNGCSALTIANEFHIV